MVLENIYILMDNFMKGIILMELKKEKEKLFFKMEIFMMGILIMVYLMDMENFIKMENGEMFYLKKENL